MTQEAADSYGKRIERASNSYRGLPEIQCGTKTKFTTKALAKRLAHRAARSSGRPMDVYICPHCAHYHFGRRAREPRQ